MNKIFKYWQQFRENRYFLKIVSVFLSVLLWLFVLNSQPVEIKKKLKINYVLPADMDFIKEPVREVSVVYRGPRAYARERQFHQKFVTVDLTDIAAKQRVKVERDVAAESIPIGLGLDLERFGPKVLELELDRTIHKKVPVILDFEGEVRKGHKLVVASARPDGVVIQGPLELMRKVQKVKTAPILLGELSGEEERQVPLQDLPARIRFKEKMTFVAVNTEVRPIEAKIVRKKLKIRFLSSKRDFSSEVKFVDVKLSLPDKESRSNKLESLYVVADIPEGGQGIVPVDLRVIIPKEFQLLEIKPARINVRIKN